MKMSLNRYLPTKEVSYTYDNKTFSSMGYVLSEGKWYKKFGFKPKPKAVVEDIPSHERVKSFNLVLKKLDLAAARTEVSNNNLDVAIQNSYASLFKRIEKSYHSFSERIINALKYFLGRP
ncbi:hypothetical protein HAX54_020068 [Datura stramonium]|uniref:Uncharacterized protein n=1 Tax=Datura stramonium TaxID=4076 RepID=A0ABS8USD6_DATST|nr:hypothetical protein [Datura stramonium]